MCDNNVNVRQGMVNLYKHKLFTRFIRDTTEPKKQLHVYGKLLTVSLTELPHRWKLYFWQREFLIFTSTFLIVGNSTTLRTVHFTELKETQISLFRMCFRPTSSFCVVLFSRVKRTKLRQQDALLASLSLSLSLFVHILFLLIVEIWLQMGTSSREIVV